MEGGIGVQKRVKHPNIKENTLPILPPLSPSNNIEMSTIFSVGSSISKRLTI